MALPKYVISNSEHARTCIKEAINLLSELPLRPEPTPNENIARLISGQKLDARYLIRIKLQEAMNAIHYE